jgi:hypothetical protein
MADIDSFISWLGNYPDKHTDTLVMNLSIIKCINGNYSNSAYARFKELLLKNYPLYSALEINNLFTCLQGIQIERYRENHPDALAEIFEVNNLILKFEAYSNYPGGNMSYGTFVTMVTIGIAKKEYGWTKDFIAKYTNLLNEKHRSSLYNYAMAELSYAEGEPGDSLKYTSKIEYEGFFMKHEVNVLKLKIFYDENDFISMQYQLDTYKKLIEGNKYVGKLQYEMYSGFLEMYSKLLKIKEKNDSTAAAILLRKIADARNLLGKEWLSAKASELV